MALNLPTLAEMDASRPRCQPKGASRLQVKAAADKEDAKQLADWRRAVWIRDNGKDRLTGRNVVKTLALDPKRGEVHHVAGRADQAVRYDRRNGVLLSLATHQKVEQNELRIVGTKWFRVGKKRYIDCDFPVKFVKAEPDDK
jgi:hypothetical protein